jgi:hypothetical protein
MVNDFFAHNRRVVFSRLLRSEESHLIVFIPIKIRTIPLDSQSVVATSWSSLAQFTIQGRVPEYPGKCYDDVTNASYDIDETWSQKGVCVQYKCSQAKNGDFLITAYGYDLYYLMNSSVGIPEVSAVWYV